MSCTDITHGNPQGSDHISASPSIIVRIHRAEYRFVLVYWYHSARGKRSRQCSFIVWRQTRTFTKCVGDYSVHEFFLEIRERSQTLTLNAKQNRDIMTIFESSSRFVRIKFKVGLFVFPADRTTEHNMALL